MIRKFRQFNIGEMRNNKNKGFTEGLRCEISIRINVLKFYLLCVRHVIHKVYFFCVHPSYTFPIYFKHQSKLEPSRGALYFSECMVQGLSKSLCTSMEDISQNKLDAFRCSMISDQLVRCKDEVGRAETLWILSAFAYFMSLQSSTLYCSQQVVAQFRRHRLPFPSSISRGQTKQKIKILTI